MNIDAIKDLLFRIADDDLIIGHRNSEWTGLGPILEEDIAFSSMAQDELGHAQAYYLILHEMLDEAKPDILGFQRKAKDFRSCHLVEYPIGDYAFSLVRHALYDIAESIRLKHLQQSAFRPLAQLAKKLGREEKYHVLHAETWIRQLGSATEESNKRMQEALNIAFPLAFGIFEPTQFDDQLVADKIQISEAELEAEWVERITKLITDSGLTVPSIDNKDEHYGGRKGKHTEHLQPLLDEMTEVVAIDPSATW